MMQHFVSSVKKWDGQNHSHQGQFMKFTGGAGTSLSAIFASFLCSIARTGMSAPLHESALRSHVGLRWAAGTERTKRT